VPRTKEFRPEAALDAAMHLFWLKGYGATSMRDLLEGMGIGRGSFYDTFGDKHALFLAALDRFEEARTSWVDEALEGSGADGIEEVFRRTVEGMTGSGPRRGCLLANTAVELAPRVLARFLVSNLHGLRVLARAGTDRRTLEDAARVALHALRQSSYIR
jgi:TetR/AcrR family transcriptional repressor of nem operon